MNPWLKPFVGLLGAAVFVFGSHYIGEFLADIVNWLRGRDLDRIKREAMEKHGIDNR